MTVPQEMANPDGNLHGGAITSIVDVSTTLLIMTLDSQNRANVSAELSVSFLSAGPVNQDIFILAQIDRLGKQLAFSQAFITDAKYKTLATGKHIKSFLDQTYSFDGQFITYPKKQPVQG